MKFLILILLAGCTDAGYKKLTSFGDSRSIKCFSGGVMIYEGVSTGKISNEQNSDGYYFVDSQTGKLLEVSGDCILSSR